MKPNLSTIRKWHLFGMTIIVLIGLMGGASLTFAGLSRTLASTNGGKSHTFASPNIVTPTPTAPSDNSIGLSATSGPPGTHIFVSASGYAPNELVQLIWNYQGTFGTIITEQSFYYFNPNRTADANGVVQENFYAPPTAYHTYTIAAVGTISKLVKTATFQLVPALDLGIYIGPPGTVLRFNGWGFGYRESVTLYWNWIANKGQLIKAIRADSKGDFGNLTFAVPMGTAHGTYTVVGIGATSHVVAQVQFTVGTPILNTQPPGPSDWPAFGYNAQGSRVNPAENTINSANVSTLALKWKSPTPVPYKDTGTPIVVNGVVYVGTIEGIVIAYNATTGNVLWTFYARGPVYGSPTIQNGIAYFGSVNIPSESIIGNFAYAVNITDGSLIWENYLPYGGEWVTPLAANGLVFFSSAYKEGVSGGFSAFDANTGVTRWSYSTPYGIWATNTLDPTGTHLYVSTGNPCYTQPHPTNCAGYLEDLNPTTGTMRWQIHFPDVSGDDDVPTTPTYDNGKLYLGTKNGFFYCIDATNGNILWQYNTGKSGDYGIFSSAAIYNNMVFFGGGDLLVHALNISDGSVAWTFRTRSTVLSSPAVANGVLYIGSGDRNVYAFNPQTGTKLWSFQTGGALWSSPTISNGILYESSADGYVYAFSLGGQ